MRTRNFADPSLQDVKAHVVRFGEAEVILWIDRGRQMQGTLLDTAMLRETLRALARWSRYVEPHWRLTAD